MKCFRILGRVAFVLAVLFAMTLGTAAAPDPDVRTKRAANKLLQESKKNVEQARAASRRGDAAATTEQARRYAQNLEQVNRALAGGSLNDADALDVATRVDEATLKHLPVLEGLLGTVPEQARPAIEGALQVSRLGHDTATQAILTRGRVSLSGGVLTAEAARAAMSKNEALAKLTERASQRGDTTTVRRGSEQYAANSEIVARAIEDDAVADSDPVSVLDRVSTNTSRHLAVLEGVLGRVPAEARPAIERAIQASQRGRQAATTALSRTPAAGVVSGRPGSAGPPAGTGGRPGGPPTGVPGPPGGKPPGRPPR